MLSCEKNSVTIQMPRRRARNWRSAIVLLATFLPTMSTRVYGEDTPKATDHDDIEQLIQSNQRLSLQVQDLQARVNQLEAKSTESVPMCDHNTFDASRVYSFQKGEQSFPLPVKT